MEGKRQDEAAAPESAPAPRGPDRERSSRTPSVSPVCRPAESVSHGSVDGLSATSGGGSRHEMKRHYRSPGHLFVAMPDGTHEPTRSGTSPTAGDDRHGTRGAKAGAQSDGDRLQSPAVSAARPPFPAHPASRVTLKGDAPGDLRAPGSESDGSPLGQEGQDGACSDRRFPSRWPEGSEASDARRAPRRSSATVQPQMAQLFDLTTHNLTDIVAFCDDGYESSSNAQGEDSGTASAPRRYETLVMADPNGCEFERTDTDAAAASLDGKASRPPSLPSSRVAVAATLEKRQARAALSPGGLRRSSAVVGRPAGGYPLPPTAARSNREFVGPSDSLTSTRQGSVWGKYSCPSFRSSATAAGKVRDVHVVYKHLQRLKNQGRAKARPPVHGDNSFKGVEPIRIFCGTWNSEYQEFPQGTMTPDASPDALMATSVLPAHLPERVVEELLDDEDAWATGDADAFDQWPGRPRSDTGDSGDVPKRQQAEERSSWISTPGDRSFEGSRMVERKSLLRASTLNLKAVKEGEQPLIDWVLPGYDVYVITLQETISDSVFHAIMTYLCNVNGRPYIRMHATEDKISGLGDGAWTQFKSTSFFNGSKGAVSLLMRIWDQFTCFLGCHMPATTTEDRIRARSWIVERLCELYSGVPRTTLDGVFHHVVWMGDFNFRTRNVSAAKAVELLDSGNLQTLLEYDECHGAQCDDLRRQCIIEFGNLTHARFLCVSLAAKGFEESPVTFPPTYKKVDGRPPVDFSDPHWAAKEYQTKFTVKWYKGGRQEDRIPSWTDRVFKWSIPEVASLLRLETNNYFAAMPSRPNSFLNASDHSPVGTGLDMFPLDFNYALPSVMNIANPDTTSTKATGKLAQ
ncbi:hypothetical protein NCLIV_041220 [Neospora caninum Liverpool]|uniref:Inositol polyphosphate-related phosphatase domain-containing protein n=1 Tax=Neospora caninum (strain Liverpool) TaxID=572307 RepID=F0VBR3_NEOCL|nr:hypothetical protein NCLIV_041220 [Neospora caninum Liverpool]CBZ51047.1 hypothetical protein NCLIV_041220 [Neospora caninum Liverpool]|eukprot:XP_003881080.1 hypothetical protein NCLIV_041220 [Neospora caninum Liverpool]